MLNIDKEQAREIGLFTSRLDPETLLDKIGDHLSLDQIVEEKDIPPKADVIYLEDILVTIHQRPKEIWDKLALSKLIESDQELTPAFFRIINRFIEVINDSKEISELFLSTVETIPIERLLIIMLILNNNNIPLELPPLVLQYPNQHELETVLPKIEAEINDHFAFHKKTNKYISKKRLCSQFLEGPDYQEENFSTFELYILLEEAGKNPEQYWKKFGFEGKEIELSQLSEHDVDILMRFLTIADYQEKIFNQLNLEQDSQNETSLTTQSCAFLYVLLSNSSEQNKGSYLDTIWHAFSFHLHPEELHEMSELQYNFLSLFIEFDSNNKYLQLLLESIDSIQIEQLENQYFSYLILKLIPLNPALAWEKFDLSKVISETTNPSDQLLKILYIFLMNSKASKRPNNFDKSDEIYCALLLGETPLIQPQPLEEMSDELLSLIKFYADYDYSHEKILNVISSINIYKIENFFLLQVLADTHGQEVAQLITHHHFDFDYDKMGLYENFLMARDFITIDMIMYYIRGRDNIVSLKT